MNHHVQTAAIVFVMSRYLLRDAARCIDYCRVQGYNMVGLIKDDWAAAIALTRKGEAEIIVVADPQHIDPDCKPRMEFVSHPPMPGAGPAGIRPGVARRTQIVKRQTEEE
jgi:hypothetical protein